MMEHNKTPDNSAKITVITVNYNNRAGLEKTIASVMRQEYENYQYLIVDGNSTDGSVDLINSFDNCDFDKVVEKDEGIYHAMNKAIAIADGEWLLFMNSGDVFMDSASLSLAMSAATEDTDVIYADWIYANSGKRVKASKHKMAVRHQSVVYKKTLHDVQGTYITAPNVTISDYIFFLSIANANWSYSNAPLSVCDESGVSSQVSHFYQKIAVDFIFQRSGRIVFLAILILYPTYKFLKNIVQWLLKPKGNH
jgi:glycosyltransferase involved in cell wall biosynthesis